MRRPVRSSARAVRVMAASEGYKWLNQEPLAIALGFGGWFIPSNIAVSAFGGKSLFGCLTESISANLANFPQGPALDDKYVVVVV